MRNIYQNIRLWTVFTMIWYLKNSKQYELLLIFRTLIDLKIFFCEKVIFL